MRYYSFALCTIYSMIARYCEVSKTRHHPRWQFCLQQLSLFSPCVMDAFFGFCIVLCLNKHIQQPCRFEPHCLLMSLTTFYSKILYLPPTVWLHHQQPPHPWDDCIGYRWLLYELWPHQWHQSEGWWLRFTVAQHEVANFHTNPSDWSHEANRGTNTNITPPCNSGWSTDVMAP